MSHVLGARAFEVHLANYWPEWGIKLIDNLRPAATSRCSARSCAKPCRSYKL